MLAFISISKPSLPFPNFSVWCGGGGGDSDGDGGGGGVENPKKRVHWKRKVNLCCVFNWNENNSGFSLQPASSFSFRFILSISYQKKTTECMQNSYNNKIKNK